MCIDIPDKLRDVGFASGLVEAYFAEDRAGLARYSGACFERLGGGGDRPEVAYQFTAEDLLAVSMLGVPVVGHYALHVLNYGAAEFSSLLARIPLDVRLADPEAGELIAEDGPAWTLWQGLHDIKPPQGGNRLGRVAAGKLLARKRPHLVPVYDSRVEEVLGRAEVRGTWWSDLRCQFTHDQALVDELESVRARSSVRHVSLLRTFDIMCWMFWEHQHGSGQAADA